MKPVLLPWVATFLIAVGAAAYGASAAPRVQTLDGEIGRVELTAGMETIGGASVSDAILLLGRRTAFPVSFEEVEHDRSKDPVVTLSSAIAKLQQLKAIGPLSSPDKARLNAYEAKIKEGQDPSTMVFVEEKASTIVEDHMTVRALLDRVTALDSAYSWRNDGTDAAPIIVVEPRGKSLLEWSIPAICPPALSSSTKLYGPGGTLTALFGQHDIGHLTTAKSPAMPDVPLDLCSDGLTAREVLNRTVTAFGGNASWSLAGIKGLRALWFQYPDR